VVHRANVVLVDVNFIEGGINVYFAAANRSMPLPPEQEIAGSNLPTRCDVLGLI
jgi:hypothetical protein